MSNRLDQFFKNKLANHTISPSANAWGRVNDGLVKKNKGPFVIRMAATILLAGALITTLLWLSSNDHQSNAISSSSPDNKAKSKSNSTKPTNEPAPTFTERVKTAEHRVSKKKQKSVAKDVENSSIDDQKNVSPSLTAPEDLQPAATLSSSVAVVPQPKEEKPIVLVYHLETIEAQTQDESPSAEPRQKSGLSKVIDFARDAKNGDAGMGDLRQAKDELFAFNFKKDKQTNHK